MVKIGFDIFFESSYESFQLDASPTGDQGFADSTPTGLAIFFHGD